MPFAASSRTRQTPNSPASPGGMSNPGTAPSGAANSVVARQAAPAHKNVLQAVMAGDIRGAANMIVNAPDPGLGPMAVVQKAGAAPLRAAMNAQAATKLATMGGKKGLAELRPSSRAALQGMTPMVQNTERKLKAATTGKPLSVVGHRTETGGVVPARGTFFASKPADAIPRTPTSTTPRVTGRRVDALQFKNPLVFEHGSQHSALQELSHNPKVRRTLRGLADRMYARGMRGDPEKWFTRVDKVIARAAKDMGHDGIIYKGPGFIVDLAGTVKKGGK